MRRLKLSSLFLALLMLVLPLPAALSQKAEPAHAAKRSPLTLSRSTLEAAKQINAEQLKKDLYWVADDARAGRDTPSAGLDETAKFIADRLAKTKVKPAGDDGTYFQKIELRSQQADFEKSRAEVNGRAFKLGSDFVLGSMTSGEIAPSPLVYVGHGWIIRSKNINAYEGLDVKDKIMVVAGGGSAPPPGITAEYIAGQPTSDWENAFSYAEKMGARAVVWVPQRFERFWHFGRRSLSRPAFHVARFADEEHKENASIRSTIPVIIPSTGMLNALFDGEKVSGAEILRAAVSNAPLQGFVPALAKHASLSVSVKVETAWTQNIVGILEGADDKLKDEYVAVGAHYDHVGSDRPDRSGDRIYNGADDDGSGTVAVLSLAEAFSRGNRPRRSILFVWHAAEEKGLWGSEYFTRYPTVPIKQIVAQLNIDMIGRSRQPGDTNASNRWLTGPHEIYVIGSKMMSTELGEMSEAVNRSYLNLKYNYRHDEPDDPEQLFYRSDHYNYALQGIPVIFYFDGIHEDYHQPSDTPDKIDYQKIEKVARTIFVLASEIANTQRRPSVDKPLSSERREH